MSNYSFIHSYKLVAQTPLIHFQWRMKNASLRASEVKPKLDRFIIKTLKENGQPVPEDWWIMKNTSAFDYKMQIHRTTSHEAVDITKLKSYFANKADEEGKRTVFYDAQLDIVCLKPALAEYIDKIIKTFFILHSFASRQSKGFGIFLVDGTTEQEIYDEIARTYGTFIYADTGENFTTLQKFNSIYTLSMIMKNGINRAGYNKEKGQYLSPERYIKGYAVREFLPENTGSDKAFIKSKVIKEKLMYGPRQTHPEYESFTFIRAMLGLADAYSFTKDDGRMTRVRVVSFNESTGESYKIEKFRSPVSIKLFGDRIYIFVEKTYKQMLGQNFVFLDEENFRKYVQCKDKDGKQNILAGCPHISTPKTFDHKKFLCGFAQYFEKNKEILRNFRQEGKFDEFSDAAELTLNVVKGDME